MVGGGEGLGAEVDSSKATHWQTPVPSRTCRKWILPLERRL